MKRALKILAFFMLTVSLFTLVASAQGKSIEWDYEYGYRETYNYGGELKLGSNSISPVGKSDWFDFSGFRLDYVYYDFDVEKTGYYNILINGDFAFVPSVSQDIRDGVVYGEKERFNLDDEGFSVYLEEGECIFGIDFFVYEFLEESYIGELNIEFIAEEITDIQIEGEYLEDIILGYHIDPEYDENNVFSIPAKGKVIFNNGKEIEFYQDLEAEYSDDIAPGENKINFVLNDFKKEYTVQVKTVDDYIENVEIKNIKDVAVVTQTFIPDYAYSSDCYIELIITKPDGTKLIDNEVYFYYDIDLKGDKQLTIWFDYYRNDDGKWYFTAESCGKEYLSIPCEIIPASFENNCFIFVEKVADCILFMQSDFSFYMSDAFGILSGLSITERFESFSDAFISIGDYCSEIYKLTEMFYNYVR